MCPLKIYSAFSSLNSVILTFICNGILCLLCCCYSHIYMSLNLIGISNVSRRSTKPFLLSSLKTTKNVKFLKYLIGILQNMGSVFEEGEDVTSSHILYVTATQVYRLITLVRQISATYSRTFYISQDKVQNFYNPILPLGKGRGGMKISIYYT